MTTKPSAERSHVVDCFSEELGCTVRDCLVCGALVAGGPTRCVLCANESADPARVGEEEQERRLRLASGWLECKETHRVQLGGHAIILDMIVEYLRAEREGRKAT